MVSFSEDQALHSFPPALIVVGGNVGTITRMSEAKLCNITRAEVRIKPIMQGKE